MARNVLSCQIKLLFAIALTVLISTIAYAERDFYRILEVSQHAEQGEIKKAYRKQSLIYHPDKNPGDEEAASKFADIARAYEVLSDQNKRQIYDQMGEEELERMEQQVTPSEYDELANLTIWDVVLRGGDRRQKGPNHKVTIKASLEELYIGAHTSVSITRNVYCKACKGTGAEGGDLKVCPKCKGQGVVMQDVNMGFMRMQMQQPCGKCGGKGKTFKKGCPKCKTNRLVSEAKTFEVDVEPGMKNGDQIVFERQGEQVPDQIQGDITFVIQQKTHPEFKRVGDNLYFNLEISLQEALLGFEKQIEHLDGHRVKVSKKSADISQPFSWIIIKNEGMPKRGFGSDKYGELHVKLIVAMPSKINEKQRQLIEQIFPE